MVMLLKSSVERLFVLKYCFKVTIDKSGANTSVLRELNGELEEGDEVFIRQSKYLNNIKEQNHRFIKKRNRLMMRFKSFLSARRALAGFEIVHMIQKVQLKTENVAASPYMRFLSFAAKNLKSILLLKSMAFLTHATEVFFEG